MEHDNSSGSIWWSNLDGTHPARLFSSLQQSPVNGPSSEYFILSIQ